MSSLLMLGTHRSYHLYRKEADIRKVFNQLCGIITNELGRQVTQGDAFIFINCTHTDLKLLVYELGGFNCTSSCRESLYRLFVIAKDVNKRLPAVEKKIIGMAD